MALQIVKLLDPISIVNSAAIIAGGIVPKGAYDAGTNYAVGDMVSYADESYVMYVDAGAGTVPTNATYWMKVAAKGVGGVDLFTELTDVPASYTGQSGKVATVKGTEDGLEFTTPVTTAVAEVITVAKSGGDYTSVKAARDYINGLGDCSLSKPYRISVAPGLYTEDPFSMITGLMIEGSGENSTFLIASNPNAHFITGADTSGIRKCLITGVTGSGYAAFYYCSTLATTNIAFFIESCKFGNNDTHVICYADTKPSTVLVSNSYFGSIYQFNKGFMSSNNPANAKSAKIVLRSCSTLGMTTPYPTEFASVEGASCEFVATGCQLRTGGTSSGSCIKASNGAKLRLLSLNIRGFAKGIWLANVGAGPIINANGIVFEDNTQDLVIDHASATGAFQGLATKSKVSIDPGAVISLMYSDPITQGVVSVGPLFIGRTNSSLTDTRKLIQLGGTKGLLYGGVVTVTGGLDVSVSLGASYVETTSSPENILKLVEWGVTAKTLNASSVNYLYFDSSGALITDSVKPNPVENTIVARIVTNATNVVFIDSAPVRADSAANMLDDFNRDALGILYETGSLVTENGTRGLDVSPGIYRYSQHEFNPSGGTGISWDAFYSDGGTGWTIIGSQSTVSNTDYDDGDGTLGTIPGTDFAKASLYTVGEGVNEKYMLVYPQATYGTLVDAQAANLPTPPDFFTEGVTPIAYIIVQAGTTNIVEIKSIRRVLGVSESTGGGAGDVVGPVSAVDSNFAAFNTTTGKLIKDSGWKAADFAPALGADDNYVTDAEKVVIGDTSGINTGDQTLPVKATGTEIDTGTDDDKFATALAIRNSGLISGAVSGEIAGLTDKPTPLDADVLMIESSADTNAKRKLTWANLKSTLGASSVPEILQNNLTPVADFVVTAGYSAIFSGKLTVSSGRKITVESGGRLKII